MRKEIKRIIQRKLKLKETAIPSSIQINSENDFYLNLTIIPTDVYIKSKSNYHFNLAIDSGDFDNIDSKFFKVHFENEKITIDDNETLLRPKIDFNIIEIIKEKELINKNNAKYLIENFSPIANFNDNLFHFAIDDYDEIQKEDFHRMKVFKMYYFDLNKNSKEILKELSNEVIEYCIRDYVFIEKGISINDSDINYFIKAFHQTNCLSPFKSSSNLFSDEFKKYLDFENKSELKDIVELLKINYSF